jgi:tetratricopeptide (TPR) repeat protein
VPVIALTLSGVIIGFVWLATANQRETRAVIITTPVDQLEVLRVRSLELEAEFERLRQKQTKLTDQDMLCLSRAVEAQEQYVNAKGLVGSDNRRLIDLRRRLHIIEAERLRERAQAEEELATKVVKDVPAKAIAALREAIDLEKIIEQKWVFSGMADPGKMAQLDTRLRRLESESLWQQGRQVEADATKMAATGDYTKAAEMLNEAIKIENEFLIKYRDVRETEFGRPDLLVKKQATWLSTPLKKSAEQNVAFAQVAEKQDQWANAVNAWTKALEDLDRLLNEFPQSEYADRTLAASWLRQKNLAQVHPDILVIEQLLTQMREALHRHEIDAGLIAARSAQNKTESVLVKFPDLFSANEPMRLELDFVLQHEATLKVWGPLLEKNLLSIPALSGVRLYRTEVSQALYAAVVGNNPSAQVRETNPVDSVSYDEAEKFCTELGWLLGTKVRLPSISEFEKACGSWDPKKLAGQAWTFENTDGLSPRAVGQAQPNEAGFQDLLGNVEEWTLAPASDVAWAVGGSVAWTPVAGLPQHKLLKREKSRLLGFRFIIEATPAGLTPSR